MVNNSKQLDLLLGVCAYRLKVSSESLCERDSHDHG